MSLVENGLLLLSVWTHFSWTICSFKYNLAGIKPLVSESCPNGEKQTVRRVSVGQKIVRDSCLSSK